MKQPLYSINSPTGRPAHMQSCLPMRCLAVLLVVFSLLLTACGDPGTPGVGEKRTVGFSELYDEETNRFSLDGYTPGMTRAQLQEVDGFLQGEPIVLHVLSGNVRYGFSSDRLCRVSYEIDADQMTQAQWEQAASSLYDDLRSELGRYGRLKTRSAGTLQTENGLSCLWYADGNGDGNGDDKMSMLRFTAKPPGSEEAVISIIVTADLSHFGPVFESYLAHFPPADDEMVDASRYIPGIFVDLMYARSDNFTGEVIYDFHTAYLRYGTVKKLMGVQKKLHQQGYSLKICDAFRPVSAQFKLWEIVPDPNFVADPYHGYSTHSRGNTVDLDLVTEDGSYVEMPTPVDTFSPLADRDYSDVSPEAERHALILQNAMVDAGFKMSSVEWWHYYDIVSYPVAKDFEPSK